MVKIKGLEFTDFRFSLGLSTSPSPRMQNRLRGMLSARGTVNNTKPDEFVAQLRSHGIDARTEEKTNACGECSPGFCNWNNCFSMPNGELQVVINALHDATIQLYDLYPKVKLTVRAQGKTYTFSYQRGINRLQYFNFDGISQNIANRLQAVPGCTTLKLHQFEGTDAEVALYMTPGTNLTRFVEEVCLAIS